MNGAPLASGALAIAAMTLVACGGSGRPADVPAGQVRASRLTGPCPRTLPNGSAPAAAKGFDHGNRSLAVVLWPKGELVAGRLPDGSIVAKLAWWRIAEGPLRIEGRRLDGDSHALRADIPAGYGPTGLQVSGVTFPTAGCWRVVGTVGGARLAFVVAVRRR